MLLVRTYIKPSPIEGIGLFAEKLIKKNTVIWRFQLGFDSLISEEEFDSLPQIAKDAVTHHMYLSTDQHKHVIMPDNARFFNHSKNPNTLTVPDDQGQIEQMTIAARDILPDEEITCDYEEFDLGVAGKKVKNK